MINNMEKGVILFNRGEKMVIQAIVAIYSLRKYWDGNVTMFLEKPYPSELEDVCKCFNVNVVHLKERPDLKVLVQKSNVFNMSPYEKTVWIDLDTEVVGKFDELFDALKENDLCLVHFCEWISSGKSLTKRINRFKGVASEEDLQNALKTYPAVNTGVLSYRKSDRLSKFMQDVTTLADNGAKKNHAFLPDEIAMQILYPKAADWGVKIFIESTKFNVSVVYGNDVEDKRINHLHGSKHHMSTKIAKHWQSTFQEMCDSNIANINGLLKYSDKRLKQFLDKKSGIQANSTKDVNGLLDTTIVTAIDEHYLPILQVTFPNWRKYKGIDKNPVIVFVYGIELTDNRLDFLRLPNVNLITWNESCMCKVESHRELMLSAFVFGVADYVKTDYWLKLDSDSYATNNKPFVTEEMKEYSLFSHKWRYSRPDHIKKLDEWSKTCWHKKIKNSKPMIEQGKIEGNRFYHNNKRIISYICLQKTRFTRYCVSLLKERKLPSPSQDTFAYYCIQKLKPEAMGVGNFKRDYGFTQGKGKLGAEHIRQKVEEVEKMLNSPNIQTIKEEIVSPESED